jgi:signal transduction histidine kinase
MQQLQEQLSHASKLASIGELVDTVAHEINTPTGIIAAHADALLLQPDQKNFCADEMLVIKKQTRRIHDYTKSLLGYSKRISLNPQPTCIKEIIEECVYMLGHRFRARQISVKQKYSPSIPKILIDRGQIEQVFINILNNAVDAIESPGLITIEVLKVGGDYDPEREFSGDGISIQIKDNGSGIKSANIDNIFHPFFSTKPPSKGTGLGLYISKSIVQRYHGSIKVSSDGETGTVFEIILPLIL